jgi:hypothetical protein
MPAPTFVASFTVHACTPASPLKNNNAPLKMVVLAIDLRSVGAVIIKLNELLVNPVPPIVTSPHLAANKATRN